MKRIFGVPISQVSIGDLCHRLADLAELHEGVSTVCLVNSQSLVEAHRDPSHMASLLDADLCLPDGWPIAALARTKRIAGADLMLAAAKHPRLGKMRHTLLGGFGVAYKAARTQFMASGWAISISTPWIPDEGLIPGVHSLVTLVRSAPCEILWVSLGCPKQEAWISKHRNQVNAKVIIGVGVAFNYLAGILKRAPVWMRRAGLEGVYRIWTEPGRWKRQVKSGIGLLELFIGLRPKGGRP